MRVAGVVVADEPIRFGVGVTDLTRLARDLHAVDADLGRGFTAAVKDAVAPLVPEAQQRASWSTRIPRSIRVGASGGRAKVRVYLRAGGAAAPHAAAVENRGQPGTFRHPVYGNRDVWVDQPARPFLWPTLVDNADHVSDDIATAIDRYLTAHGL